jgi:hypothetical protein
VNRLRFTGVHDPECVVATRLIAAGFGKIVDTHAASDYDLPHVCLPGGWAGPAVARVIEVAPDHDYTPGNMHPVGLREPLCGVCRHPRKDHTD